LRDGGAAGFGSSLEDNHDRPLLAQSGPAYLSDRVVVASVSSAGIGRYHPIGWPLDRLLLLSPEIIVQTWRSESGVKPPQSLTIKGRKVHWSLEKGLKRDYAAAHQQSASLLCRIWCILY
jgi:hypothetical protein